MKFDAFNFIESLIYFSAQVKLKSQRKTRKRKNLNKLERKRRSKVMSHLG